MSTPLLSRFQTWVKEGSWEQIRGSVEESSPHQLSGLLESVGTGQWRLADPDCSQLHAVIARHGSLSEALLEKLARGCGLDS